MKNSIRVTGVIILIISVISGVGYVYYLNQLDSAVSSLDIVFDSVELNGLRLLPSPEANLTLIYVANNTREVQFRVTMNGELYYGSHYLTPLTVEDALIRANSLSTVRMNVRISNSILNTIDPENKNEYLIQGDLVVTARILGLIPVTVTKSLSDYQSGQS